MIKASHSKISSIFVSFIIICNCNASAMIDAQPSTVSATSPQLLHPQSNNYPQRSFNNAPSIMSQNSFLPGQINPTQINSAVDTGNISNQFSQIQFQPTIGNQSVIPHASIKQYYNSQNGKRTCLEAMQSSLNKGISDNYCILDLSNTTDFDQNADLVTQQFFIQIQAKGIKYIYMDLYNSSVNDTYISKWSAQFKQAGMQVLWNLSGNKSVSDQTIVLLGSLDNVSGLNIAGTSVSDIGATQLVSMLSGVNPVCIDFINIYRTQISNIGRTMLESKFSENVNRWNVMHPDKQINGRGIINDLGLKIDRKNSSVASPATSTQIGVSQPGMPAVSPWVNPLGQSLVTSNAVNAGAQRPSTEINTFGTTPTVVVPSTNANTTNVVVASPSSSLTSDVNSIVSPNTIPNSTSVADISATTAASINNELNTALATSQYNNVGMTTTLR